MAEFLTTEQEERIVEAINEAEKLTSGEVRVHIEKKCKNESPVERAQEVFAELEMHQTAERNGVIVYVAYKDHKVAIWGDEGIHAKVGQKFWEQELELILQHFREGDYETGLIEGVLQIGQKLKENFPYQGEADVDELPNEISYKKENDD